MKFFAAAAVLVLAAWCAWFFRPAPAAADFALTDLNGRQMRLVQPNNRCTLLYFWYPSCPACAEQTAQLQSVATGSSSKDLRVLAVALPYDSEATVRRYVSERRTGFQTAIDASGQVAASYGVTVVPTTFLIDPQQRILKTYVGKTDAGSLKSAADRCTASAQPSAARDFRQPETS